MPRSTLPIAVVAAVLPVLQRPLGGPKASVAATAGSRGWFCLKAAGLIFLSKAEDRFCRVRQALQGRVSSGCEECLGMVNPTLAGIQSRDREQGTH